MTADQLAGAARYLDSLSESEGGLLEALKAIDLPPDDALYVASQRALRCVLTQEVNQVSLTLTAVLLSTRQAEVGRMLTAAIMDGICIGLGAAKGLNLPQINPRQPSDN